MKQSYFSKEPQYKPYVFRELKGRYAHWPAASGTAKRTIILVYGQHATLERIEPIAQALMAYGDVYAVDNPGFGGMDPSYRINEYPSLDFFASHLKHFVTDYIPKDRQITFLGISYGFQIVTTLLAKEPVIASRTEQSISFVGFVHPSDFNMPLSYTILFKYFLANIGRTAFGSQLLKALIRPVVLRFVYFLVRPFNVKYKSLTKNEAKNYVGEQSWLWMINDHRTHAATGWDFLYNNDLTKLKIAADGMHVGVPRDHLLKNSKVADELRGMYQNLRAVDLNLANHAPLDVDSPDKVTALLPDTLKAVLTSSRNKVAITK